MTKADLINDLSARSGESKATCDRVLHAFVTLVRENICENTPVHVAGLGTFKQVQRAARLGRNPQTGEAVKVPATLAPKFYAASAFKAAMPAPRKTARKTARK